VSVAFVAGATGYTGREVARVLVRRGVTTHAHVRPDSRSLADWRARFTDLGALVNTTPWQPEAIVATLQRLAPDFVFALLGTTQRRMRADAAGDQRSDYEAVDYGLTMLLVRAAAALPKRPKLVYLSSVGVGANARGQYLQVRQRVETELRATTLPFAIARPSFITGPDRDEARPLERTGAAVLDKLLGVAPRAWRERYRSTSAEVLARALVRIAVDDPRTDHVFESEELR
jgi:nucleoside-diphosphate-sugar epimerase